MACFESIDVSEDYDPLDLLRKEIQNAKIQVKTKFQTVRNRLDSIENERIGDLDFIMDQYEKFVTDRKTKVTELEEARCSMFGSLKQNDLQPALQRVLTTLDCEKKEIEKNIIEIPNILVTWDDLSFEEGLQKICQINEIKGSGQCLRTKPLWHKSKRGIGLEELNHPRGITIDPETQNIFVADCLNDRIQVFGSNGEFLHSLGEKSIQLPRRLCIYDQFLYITCGLHQFNKINKTTGQIIDQTAFDFSHSGIDSDGVKYMYICDLLHLQVNVIRLANLKFKRKIALKVAKCTDTQTRDIRVTSSEIFVLFHKATYALQSFSLEGVLQREIIRDIRILEAKYFCIDSDDNFVVSDLLSHQVKIFSPYGDLIQVVGQKGKERPGELFEPQGITVDKSGHVFILDRKIEFCLQAF